jgi:site-specific DNA-methyltransferase (adenine-specific)
MIEITNEDNMELMARYPDNHFDLAIVDPPYGIDADKNAHKNGVNCKANGFAEYKLSEWDSNIPDADYFNELFRVSKEQIVWGGNYMTDFLPPSMCWLLWDKGQRNFSFADGELAWTSFNKALRIFEMPRSTALFDAKNNGGKVHPTQKPVKLYEWLLMNYAKEGDKILDTHLGSGSIAIACHNLGYSLTACELDKDYYDAAVKRLKQHQAQQTLF